MAATRKAPIFTLIVLAPAVAELLFGSVRISTIFVLIPQFMTWGCGALILREAARRWGGGGTCLLLLGLALAVTEEWLMQQTSLSPLVGVGQIEFGRIAGVNWPYFLWALGYESVWVLLIPVQLTELLYPACRHEPWLTRRGWGIAAAIFAVGGFLAWYGWTQRARVAIFHMVPYTPPAGYLITGAAAAVLLVFAASRAKSPGAVSGSPTPAPGTLRVGILATIFGTGWSGFVLLGWGSGLCPHAPLAAVLGGALVWALLAWGLIARWSRSQDWSDAHRYALVCGGILGCMLGGFAVFFAGGATPIDWIGKAALNLAAIFWLWRVAPRSQT